MRERKRARKRQRGRENEDAKKEEMHTPGESVTGAGRVGRRLKLDWIRVINA